MKKIFIVFICIFFLVGCENKQNALLQNQIIGQDIADLSFFFNENEKYVLCIPLMIQNRTSEIKFLGLKDANVSNMSSEVCFDEDYKGISLGGIILTIDKQEKEIYADTALLEIDGKIVEYNFGKIYSKRKEKERTNDRLFYFSSTTAQAPLVEFTENMMKLQAEKKAEFTNLYFSSNEIVVDKDSISEFLRLYDVNQEADIRMKLIPGTKTKVYRFGTCVEGKDYLTGEIINEYALVLTQNNFQMVQKQIVDEYLENSQ